MERNHGRCKQMSRKTSISSENVHRSIRWEGVKGPLIIANIVFPKPIVVRRPMRSTPPVREPDSTPARIAGFRCAEMSQSIACISRIPSHRQTSATSASPAYSLFAWFRGHSLSQQRSRSTHGRRLAILCPEQLMNQYLIQPGGCTGPQPTFHLGWFPHFPVLHLPVCPFSCHSRISWLSRLACSSRDSLRLR